ncbi:MAG TPA: hypothetical protein VKK79_22375, partial [Candidatus Lokiarchaeia archaeon]|nr:hypothetical protein [Candidatus Lokiarchaeia archaeon]
TMKALQEGASEEVSDERQILENLIAATDEKEADEDKFETSGSSAEDPFGGGATAKDPFASGSASGTDPFAANPFGSSTSTETASSEDIFADNPFQQQETMAQIVVPTVDRTPKSGALLLELKNEDLKRPKAPASPTPEQKVNYLEELVDHQERKIRILSKIANALQEKEKLMDEKDKLIGKLLLLLK